MEESLPLQSNITVAEYLAWVRGALGQSVYQQLLQSSPQALNFDRVITLEEQYLYGSKRLGVRRPQLELGRAAHNPNGYEVPVEPTPPAERFGNACLCTEPIPGGEEPYYPGVAFAARFYTHTLGMKEYEITNHLGNVLATVLDRKTGVKASPTATTYAYFKADVTTAQDYYPFGSLMPGRTYVAPANAAYRFGFNGMQRDDELKGPGNAIDFGARMYDSRLGRWMSVDPLASSFPFFSPYLAMNTNPLNVIDPDGESGVAVVKGNEMIIKQNFYYTTDPNARGFLTPSQAKAIEENIRNGYNSLNGKVSVNGIKYQVRFEVNFIDMTGKENGQIVDAVTNDTYKGHRIGNFLSTSFWTNVYEKNDAGAATSSRVDVLVDKMKAEMEEGKSDGNTPTHEALHNLGGIHEDGGMLLQNKYKEYKEKAADGSVYTFYKADIRKMTSSSLESILKRSFSGDNKDLPIVNENP